MAVARMGGLTATLMNGVFGNPLVHLRLMNQKQSMLFDLGNGERLPSRLAHQLTHVFITHAHMDHIGGFLTLLRSRIGDFPPCNLYGPPGLADHIEGMIRGVHWDRIGESGPRFRVTERHGDYLQIFGLQAGKKGIEQIGREHKKKAASSGHLTARACGEIARAANVNQVIPFHFSKRYESKPWQVYDEVRSACARVVIPPQSLY